MSPVTPTVFSLMGLPQSMDYAASAQGLECTVSATGMPDLATQWRG
jgi:hypothetical protein